MKRLTFVGLAALLCLPLCPALPANVADAIKTIRAVGAEGRGNADASAAWKKLADNDAGQIVPILAGMDDASEITANWLRSAVDTIASRAGNKLPVDALLAFIGDSKHNPRARRFAFELVAKVQPESAEKLLPGMLNDPSLELRRDAVQRVIADAARTLEAGKKPEAIQRYQEALRSARDVDQIQSIAKSLRDLGETVDLPKVFGFLTVWKVIGSFHNKDGKGYAEVFPPEKQIDLAAEYDGVSGKVRWSDYTTPHEFGMVNFNPVYTPLKEVTAYAYTEFVSDKARPAELRLGCKNGWKVWLNGKLLAEREEYHRGMQIDQYPLACRLQAGRNTILVKACQNELVEKWTVEWQFQLRVCDHLGTAILPSAPPSFVSASSAGRP
ncbi:MAG: HEAT repeat domain-containing protein [Verrucomicrobia bacterium]|nr:HEAT repeat domain-containing protein [Verrucomicrobiota bacterium]